jgi:hypothetical protein
LAIEAALAPTFPARARLFSMMKGWPSAAESFLCHHAREHVGGAPGG